MYTTIKHLQILIALLKEHNIKHIVISPGSRMKDFVFSIEKDSFFTCYSVVDERSAAYFAMGISQELNVSVAITCTSSTATANYLPGITEAYHQGIPILVLTGDRHPYYLGQMEDQMINQMNMYERVVKKSIMLPHAINNNDDFWYCERLINEAILELDHRGRGPVHINIPVPTFSQPLTEKKLPKVKVIRRVILSESSELLDNKVSQLKNSQKILVIAGQNTHPEITTAFVQFFEKYNCVFHAENLANFQHEGTLNLAIVAGLLSTKMFEEIIPDIVISFDGALALSGLKAALRTNKFEHWLINENGNVVDGFRNLTTIFECKTLDFFNYFVEHAESVICNNKIYYNNCFERKQRFTIPSVPFSNVSIIEYFLKRLPENSLLHLSILNSIRISNFFELPLNTKVYANAGCDGIDGSMSTFLGQASVSERLSFLIIGDLSFFYDMNSLRIQHNRNNIRILLINNHGGGEFHIINNSDTADLHIAAKHNTNAKGWAESVGFKYLFATTETEYSNKFNQFIEKESNFPILFEVFTDMNTDADTVKLILFNSIFSEGEILKTKIRSLIGSRIIDIAKKILP